MAGIKIDFLADVSKFLGKTKDVEKALDDVSDALDDLSADAKKSGDKLGEGLSDGAKEAGTAVGKLEGDFRQAFDEVRKDAKKAGDAIGDGVKGGTHKAEGALGEFKDEAKSTAREGAASFSGEFEDVADVVQETLANALAGFGPMGAAAGMAAAAGVGILVSELTKSAEKAEEARERVVSLAGAIREAGGDLERVDWAGQMEEFAEGIADAKEWFEVWQKDSKTNLESISEDAERLGLTFKDVFRGLAGEPEAMARALAEVDAALAASREQSKALIEGGYDPLSASMQSGEKDLQAYRDRLIEAGAETDRATKYARDLESALDADAEATEEAADWQRIHAAALRGSAEALGLWNDEQDRKLGLMRDEAGLAMELDAAEGAWAEQMASTKDVVKELSEAIDTSSKRTREATDATDSNRAAWDLNTEAGRIANDTMIDTSKAAWGVIEALREQGADSEALRARTAKLRDQFILTATQMGMTRAAAEKLADEYGLIPRSVETTVILKQPNISAFLSRLQSRINANPLYVPSYAPAPVARASGGPVSKGRLYRVGEEGEELFVPDQDGQIIPADETRDIMRGPSGGQPTTSAAPAAAVGASPEAIRAALEGMSLTVDLDNGRVWFGRQMAAQRRSDLIEARAR